MPNERDSYRHFRLTCGVCQSLAYVRTLPIYRPATLMLCCPSCRNDICMAVFPDTDMDGKKQQCGLWAIPLMDLIYLESGLTEEEGDRLLWGNKHVLEQRLGEYRAMIAVEGTRPAGSVDSSIAG